MKDSYRALTRAYRPQTFDDIVAQGHVSSTLKNAIRNGRLSHAYMFCGPRGVGKTTMARVLAREVNQVDSTVDGEALGHTLNIVEMDAASNRKIEDVRSLKEVIRVPPQNGRYKIFIIDEVHMLTKEAFNALLKTLEEPPGHAIFIFATTEPHKVLPTILSRVQRFDFKRISVDEIVRRLREIADRESVRIDDESLHVIAKRADGALRDALGLMDQAIAFCGTEIDHRELLNALNIVGVGELFELTEAIAARDADRTLELVQELVRAGTDIQEFLVSLTEHLRNLYVASGSDRLYLIEATDETRERYRRHAEAFGEEDLMRMLHLVSETQLQLREARQPRVQFEILVLKLVHMNPVSDLRRLMSELDGLKKKADSSSVTSNPSEDSGRPQTENGAAVPKREPEDDTGRNTDVDAEPQDEACSSETELPNRPAEPEPEAEAERPVKSTVTDAGDHAGETEKPSDPGAGPSPVDEDELFGRPSLGSAPGPENRTTTGTATGGNRSGPGAGSTATVQSSESDTEKAVKPIALEDVNRCWDPLLEELRRNAPRTLYFQMQRVSVSTLRGNELIVTADNEFARQLLDQHRKLLHRCFARVLGRGLNVMCKVERQKKERDETLSPYERFRELQKKDPKIRKLVELFGAELEY